MEGHKIMETRICVLKIFYLAIIKKIHLIMFRYETKSLCGKALP